MFQSLRISNFKMKKNNKTSLIIAITSGILLISIPLSLVCIEVSIPSQFSDTYYGELAKMHDHLKETSKKKIIFVGNSAVSFGIDSSLVEKELTNADYDYEACNFGLYGSIGTKAMLELSKKYIKEGDIVILMPEEYPQAMSTYFSGTELWRALDSDRSLLNEIPSENNPSLLVGYLDYLPKKYSYYLNGKEAITSIYQSASFDDHCDLKNFERKENVMADYYDSNNIIDFSQSFYDETYITMINDYAKSVKENNASIYYSFAPMNRSAVTSLNLVNDFYSVLQSKINFSCMNYPLDSVMEANWFYDSNYHLNSLGSQEYTLKIISDIKNQLGDTSANITANPTMPDLPAGSDSHDGDNTQLSYFTYEAVNDEYYRITGISEEGKGLTDLIIPATYNNLPIKSFTATIFNDDLNLKTITIQENINRLYDYSFTGCTNLEKIILKQSAPGNISVGYNLLDGASSCLIYVPKGSLSNYSLDYFWGHYSGYLKEVD